MALLRKEGRFSLSQKLSTAIIVNEEEAEGEGGGKEPEEMIEISASEYTEYRLEKVFPMYALGTTKKNHYTSFLPSSTLGDPIWDAIREEAKLEVRFFILPDFLEFLFFNFIYLFI